MNSHSVLGNINIGIFGELNAGKCSLAKALNIACGSISNPNNFVYENRKFFILPIPCIENDYKTKYELSSSMCDIALIVVDSSDVNLSNDLIIDLIRKNKNTKIVICLNKIDKVETDNLPSLDSIKLFMNISQNIVDFFNCKEAIDQIKVVYISCKENMNLTSEVYQSGQLLDCISKLADEVVKENIRDLKFLVYDHYQDTENCHFVLTGRNFNSKLNVGDEIINPKFSHFNHKIEKICDCQDSYVNQVQAGEFVTIKIPLENIDPNAEMRGEIFTVSNTTSDLIVFTTFEAEAIINNIDENCQIITAGSEFIFDFNILTKCCTIESLFEQKSNKWEKAKFIKQTKDLKFKAIFQTNQSELICRSKHETDEIFGSFAIKTCKEYINNKFLALLDMAK